MLTSILRLYEGCVKDTLYCCNISCVAFFLYKHRWEASVSFKNIETNPSSTTIIILFSSIHLRHSTRNRIIVVIRPSDTPTEIRWKRPYKAQSPNKGKWLQKMTPRAFTPVFQRIRDGSISVNGNGTQMKDRRGTTKVRSESPSLKNKIEVHKCD